eukprot:SAG22_NODE_185_length_15941_cov_8.668034_6_plen_213_part_00
MAGSHVTLLRAKPLAHLYSYFIDTLHSSRRARAVDVRVSSADIMSCRQPPPRPPPPAEPAAGLQQPTTAVAPPPPPGKVAARVSRPGPAHHGIRLPFSAFARSTAARRQQRHAARRATDGPPWARRQRAEHSSCGTRHCRRPARCAPDPAPQPAREPQPAAATLKAAVHHYRSGGSPRGCGPWRGGACAPLPADGSGPNRGDCRLLGDFAAP